MSYFINQLRRLVIRTFTCEAGLILTYVQRIIIPVLCAAFLVKRSLSNAFNMILIFM